MEIFSGVYMLDLADNMTGTPRSFHPTILRDEDHMVLVDTGFPGMFPLLNEAILQTGAALADLTHVILTHHDIDHIGNLAVLLRELDGRDVKVLAFKDEIPYIDGTLTPLKLAQMEENLDALPPDRKAFYDRMKAGFKGCFVPVDQSLSDGEVLPFCGGIQVIHTPGHTHGHICLYMQKSKTLIAGDSLSMDNGRLAPAPLFMNHDIDQYWRSLPKLAAFDIDSVVCYHGGLCQESPSQQIAELINKRQ